MYVIYALVDPRDSVVHYVGMSGDVYKRFIQHISMLDNNREKNVWIAELKTLGIVPILQTLEVVRTLKEAQNRESDWINHYKQMGTSLTNIAACYPKYLPTKRLELSSSDDVRQTIRQLLARGMPRREVCKRVGLSGRKYHIFQEVCKEENIMEQMENEV